MDSTFLHRNRLIHFVDSASMLAGLIQEISKLDVISVDMEMDSLHRYQDRVCLIQVSTKISDWILDPLSTLDLSSFWSLLESPKIVKIFHDADFDLRSLNRDYHLKVKNIFDTKISAELLGWKSLGLSSLLTEFFGVKLSKSYQRYNWSRRPINRKALIYAAMDTRYLLDLKVIQEERLREAERFQWAVEEFRNLENFRWQPSRKDRLKYWTISGVKQLEPQQLACLRMLWEIRDTIARKRDVPYFKVFNDSFMMKVASHYPEKQVKRLIEENSQISSKLYTEIMEHIETLQTLNEADYPDIPAEMTVRSPKYNKEIYQKLKDNRDRAANQFDLDPGIIISSKKMKSLAALHRSAFKNPGQLREEHQIRPWQWEMIGVETIMK